ncbi:chondroitin 4-O-sulfotransferase [Cupriavidus sp. UGS-1]|uniref:chondroitin 4-O-sulfotransferase n=1 Tax=Cupriavidus sp. UGS-1 TaxID=2899826 RepID=UPI001E330485|nr:chondroitin 4-O-sulfotransferase [Cupriavidus sp. UGS-1]MCD9120188.1 chondroitin 4-O-sulfotransferase [Cupriavidus sp. UGS-1]
MQSPIFFIHPPKSGGSTVISFFELNRGERQFVHFEWDRDPEWRTSLGRLVETGVGGGHHSFGMHRFLKRPLAYCTILRDPLARQISHYWYAFNGKNGEVERGASVSTVEAMVRRGEISLDEWVAGSYAGKNLYVHMLSGDPALNEHSLDLARYNLRHHIPVAGLCEDMSAFLLRLCGRTGFGLPFYAETNVTNISGSRKQQLSESAREKFLADNAWDYALYQDVRESNDRDKTAGGELFDKALALVRTVQAELNQVENPHEHASMIFGYDHAHLGKLREIAQSFDLAPIRDYIEHSQQSIAAPADIYEGFVDAVRENSVSGWAINLTRPDRPVSIEVWSGNEMVAAGTTGEPRPDVAAAGYGSSHTGFSIALPPLHGTAFRVAIAGASDPLNNAGPWRQGWHIG